MELVYTADLKSVPYGMRVRPPPRPPNKIQPRQHPSGEATDAYGNLGLTINSEYSFD